MRHVSVCLSPHHEATLDSFALEITNCLLNHYVWKILIIYYLGIGYDL